MLRAADLTDTEVPRLQARDLLFSGTTCTGGEAQGAAFIPVAVFGACLSLSGSVVFAVGLRAGNVPEGLLPVITLALAVAVSSLARRGALVKRRSS